jgi:dinuclear metal center YbgI/SA1388 family protein
VTQVRDVVAALAERTRPERAAAWDPVGLQIGDADASVQTVAVCHEVTEEVVAQIEESPVDLLISYHPLLFQPTNRIRAGRSAEARSYRLIRAGVSLLVTHTDFDAAEGGTADALAGLLGLRDVTALGADPIEDVPAIGRVGVFEATLAVLDAEVSDAFGHTGLRITGDRHRHLDRVAVVPGSGAGFIEVAAEVADALVTGDVSHHRCVLATDLGLAIVDPGHIATERPGMTALVELVGQTVDTEVRDLTSINPKTWG